MDTTLGPRVSLCVIARDEEAALPGCLASAAGLAAEAVVLDTGSVDRTREVAAAAGARVAKYAWADSFADARNACAGLATKDWIVWLDADDRLDPDDRDRLIALLADPPAADAGYFVRYASPLSDRPGGPEAVVRELRVVRNRPEYRWRYRVHEQLLPAVREHGGGVRPSGVTVRHGGYADPAARRRKVERNLRLSELDAADRPSDPFVRFYLGFALLDLGRPADALPHLVAAGSAPPGLSFVPKLHALTVEALARVGRRADARAACRAARAAFPADAELLYRAGVFALEGGDGRAAEGHFRPLLGPGVERHELTPADLCGHKALHGLAAACGLLGRVREQESCLRRAVRACPDFAPGWLALGELCADQRRWPEAGEAAEALDRIDPGGAAIVRARVAAGRGEFAAAARGLREAAGRSPGSAEVRLALGQVLALEGRDPAGAERAVREALALAPGHEQATRLLAALTRPGRRGRG